jgi:probable rRNA maturation factor
MEPGESSPTVLVRVPRRIAPGAKRSLQRFARQVSVQIAAGRAFTCVIAGDRTLQRLNREYLGRDYATDVLSFPSGDSSFLGDLAISAVRAQAQARAFGHGLLDEIRILMLHGVLHLLGYDHEIDRGKMARAERKWRATFSLPTSLIERSYSGPTR